MMWPWRCKRRLPGAERAPVGTSCSQGSQPLKQRRVISPFTSSVVSRRITHRRLARLERLGLHLNRDLGVSMGRVQVDMTEPGPDDVDFNARLEQMDRRRMTERVRRDAVAGGLLPAGGVPAHDLVDPEAREWLTRTGDEHRIVGARPPTGEQLAQALCSERPQRTDPPLVSLAVQMNPRRGCEVEMADAQTNHFLDPRSGVVEKQEQGVVTQRERPAWG